MLALIPVQEGMLAVGAEEAVAECGGRCLLLGSRVAAAAELLVGVATDVRLAEVGQYRPMAWSRALAPLLANEGTIVVPGSADGRGLAPHIAAALTRPLVNAAAAVGESDAVVVEGDLEFDVEFERAVVVMIPGIRSVVRSDLAASISTVEIAIDESLDATLVEVLPADAATLDLASATRIVAGGAGLKTAENLELLRSTGLLFGASLGATRVLTDAGWLEHARQIGTTGVEIDPELYLTVGVSGAVQHIMGIGNPSHVISVNTDATCPMMNRADLALVTDGPAFVAAFAKALDDELATRETEQT